jgi:hypothetical protein
MKNVIEKIKFKNRDYLLIGNRSDGGAIATEECFENFEQSFAHLMPNKNILRFGVKIGTIKDIIFLNK